MEFRSLLLAGALPRKRLASPAGWQTGVAELFFKIVKGLPRLAQLIGFHKLPHLEKGQYQEWAVSREL